MARAPFAPVLGVDVGTEWSSTGSALLVPAADGSRVAEVRTRVLAPAPAERLDAASLAARIDAVARTEGARAVSLDGPQGWRDPASTCRGVGRHGELSARCPGKTGARGVVYPGTYARFVNLCVDMFALLLARPGVLLANDPAGVGAAPHGGYVVLESFPTSTWRASGLPPLPGHRSAPPAVVTAFAARLSSAYGLPRAARAVADHDELQAIVAALAGAALLGGPGLPRAHGVPGWVSRAGGTPHRVEGLIWDSSLRSPEVPPGRRGGA